MIKKVSLVDFRMLTCQTPTLAFPSCYFSHHRYILCVNPGRTVLPGEAEATFWKKGKQKWIGEIVGREEGNVQWWRNTGVSSKLRFWPKGKWVTDGLQKSRRSRMRSWIRREKLYILGQSNASWIKLRVENKKKKKRLCCPGVLKIPWKKLYFKNID